MQLQVGDGSCTNRAPEFGYHFKFYPGIINIKCYQHKLV